LTNQVEPSSGSDQPSVREFAGTPVLCREEALVYLENYLRGERLRDDMLALFDYLDIAPAEDLTIDGVDINVLRQRLRQDFDRLGESSSGSDG